jgi:hypothetical protein
MADDLSILAAGLQGDLCDSLSLAAEYRIINESLIKAYELGRKSVARPTEDKRGVMPNEITTRRNTAVPGAAHPVNAEEGEPMNKRKQPRGRITPIGACFAVYWDGAIAAMRPDEKSAQSLLDYLKLTAPALAPTLAASKPSGWQKREFKKYDAPRS